MHKLDSFGRSSFTNYQLQSLYLPNFRIVTSLLSKFLFFEDIDPAFSLTGLFIHPEQKKAKQILCILLIPKLLPRIEAPVFNGIYALECFIFC